MKAVDDAHQLVHRQSDSHDIPASIVEVFSSIQVVLCVCVCGLVHFYVSALVVTSSGHPILVGQPDHE